MKKHLIFIVILALSSLACLCLPGWLFLEETPLPLPSPRATRTTTPLSCEEKLSDLLWESYQGSSSEGEDVAMEYTLITYAVEGETITVYDKPTVLPKLRPYQQDPARHQELWNFIVQVIPPEYRREVAYFVITTDGPSGNLGAVEQTDRPDEWSLYLDIQDANNRADLVTTLIHETAHLFTLNTSQVATDWDVFYTPDDEEAYARGDAACNTYFLFEGCSYPNSYLNLFFERYWQELYPEWLEINQETDEKTLDNLLYDFYSRYPDQFVSDYAATSPEEDIAESFLFFVLSPAPAGETIAEEKILFFYDFPELVELRQSMRDALCTVSIP